MISNQVETGRKYYNYHETLLHYPISTYYQRLLNFVNTTRLFNNYSSSPRPRPRAEWAFDSEAVRVRGIIFLVKSN